MLSFSVNRCVVILIICCFLVPCYDSLKGDLIGCYSLDTKFINTHSGGSIEICTFACEEIYYRYAILTEGSNCYCGNTPGISVLDDSLCNMPCPRNGSQLCGGEKAGSVYDTNFMVSGPPTDIKIGNVTETTIRVWWKEPAAHGLITGFRIKAKVIVTFANILSRELEWDFSNNTNHTQLVNLHPGTLYNVTICALSPNGPGVEVHEEIETDIGTPEPSPPEIVIKERHGDWMRICMPLASNINGPITKFRIVVVNEEMLRVFSPEYLTSYNEAAKNDLPYYITAELDRDDLPCGTKDFVIGDKKEYNGYYNAPLPQSKDIGIAVGIVSEKKGISKVRYSHSSKVMVLNVRDEKSSSVLLMLGAGVALGAVLLLLGIGAIIVLRRRVGLHRRQRLSQSMPLSGPCVEIENTGFIPDEEERVDHYGNLKRQLWNIPRNFLEVDATSVIGSGNFGQFVRGRVQHQGSLKPSLVQVIADGELSKSDKKTMLGELDLLIKSNGHENVVSLIGICEIPDTLYVVLEEYRNNLKDMLLSARHRDIQNNKFSLTSENTILKISLDIAKGMEYLGNKKILHKKLCCRNIIIVDGSIPKIGGFGLSHMYSSDSKPDYTRWTAQEMFKQNYYHVKSDVWSYGCLLWEVLSLGGTLYPSVPNKDVSQRVIRGMRPSQLPYIGDELYQICLHCWQLDLDERPTFPEIVNFLDGVVRQDMFGVLSFTHFNGFQYEPHCPEYETIHYQST